MKRFKKIYVAGPYSATDERATRENVINAGSVGLELICNGWNVIIPHKNFSFMDNFIPIRPELTNELFYDLTLDLLAECDAIYLMENWAESTGAQNKFEYAAANGIQIFFHQDGYPTPEELTAANGKYK